MLKNKQTSEYAVKTSFPRVRNLSAMQGPDAIMVLWSRIKLFGMFFLQNVTLE